MAARKAPAPAGVRVGAPAKKPVAKRSEKLFGKVRAKGTVELDGAVDYRAKLWKHVLQNAVFHGGKADARAVFGRAMAAEPELRADPAAVQEAVAELVVEANGLGLEKQRALLEGIAPELLVKEEKPTGLPELPGAKDGAVVTRFAPAPTGALHIGHIVRAAMLSYLYAKRYHGQFILRIEDTDAKKLKPEFYEWIPADLRAVGIAWDQELVESDFMDAYYDVAGKLLADGKLYVCLCTAEGFSKLKEAGKDCAHRKHIAEENVSHWRRMLLGEAEEGTAVVRLKTSMQHKNPALRDPPLLRVSKVGHPRQGTKYWVWPLYNFANVVCDHFEGVTHVFRAKEHQHNTEIQELLYRAAGWEPPLVINFGMVYLPGEKLHKRDIREGMASGKFAGWDDIQLNTIRAFLRRGFQPAAFKELAELCGLSKTDIRLGWENIEGVNRKYIDPLADRYMVVREPVELALAGAPAKKEVVADKHPSDPKRGKKRMPLSTRVWIAKADYEKLKGKTVRLRELFNVTLENGTARYAGDAVEQRMPKVQWVSEPYVTVRVVSREGEWDGIGEQAMAELKPGVLIQMERIGFGRVDSVEAGPQGTVVTVWFAHP